MTSHSVAHPSQLLSFHCDDYLSTVVNIYCVKFSYQFRKSVTCNTFSEYKVTIYLIIIQIFFAHPPELQALAALITAQQEVFLFLFRKSVTCYTFSEFEAPKRRHGRIRSAAGAGRVPKPIVSSTACKIHSRAYRLL